MMQSFEQQSKTKKEEGIKSRKWLNKFKRKVKGINRVYIVFIKVIIEKGTATV